MIRSTSPSFDVWNNQRLLFSKSLAINSVIGYILGLGDRHPSNILVNVGGQVAHVDFGDCFDVTMVREKFPERVPFRLTRQLVNALGVGGLEGTFRITAERMMDLIQKNSDTIMAMLEAFIYDPLITWKLVGDNNKMSRHAKGIVEQVHAKISGFPMETISTQVDRLLREATAHENLASLYLGYCAFW
jgi:FKBP12-rapamycin complex-associated protein